MTCDSDHIIVMSSGGHNIENREVFILASLTACNITESQTARIMAKSTRLTAFLFKKKKEKDTEMCS